MTATPRETLQSASLLIQNPDRLPPGQAYRIALCAEARIDFMYDFMGHGGTIIEETPDLCREQYFANPMNYTLNALGERDDEVLQMAANSPDIPTPKTLLFSEAQAQGKHLEPPYVFALMDKSSGYGMAGFGKYLIETPEQHQRLQEFAAEELDSPYNVMTGAEEREFITTPGNHYSSYRLIMTAAGTMLAAGLLYSEHSVQSEKPVTSNFDPLASPYSDFYLEARDIRSNVSQGGRVIPLMGADRQPLQPADYAVLEDHGIDPDRPAVPSGLKEIASTVAQDYGRQTGLLFGVDFLQSVDGPMYLLEVNSGYNLGLNTFAACHEGRTYNTSSYKSIYRAVFRHIVEKAATQQQAVTSR